jgi:CRP-like cAMP-binding protein
MTTFLGPLYAITKNGMKIFPESVRKIVGCGDCKVKSCAAAVLSPDELDLVNKNSSEAEFRKGDIILLEGSMISHIIYLKSGLVKEYQKGPGDKEQILQIVRKFTYLGLPSLFGDRINHYSYAALEDITVCYIDLNIFNRLIRQNGNFAYEILVSLSRDSLNNFHRFMSQSEKKTFGRVADALLYFARIIYEENAFELPFTRQELADLIGISRESATRVLTRFREEKIIEIEGRRITILNRDLLQQICKNG